MMENFNRRSMAMDFSIEIINLNKTVKAQEIMIDELELKAAMYKANFFQKYDLAEKLQAQITENYNSCVGEFDGFCYASWRARAVYRTLVDMYRDNIITKEEHSFCEV